MISFGEHSGEGKPKKVTSHEGDDSDVESEDNEVVASIESLKTVLETYGIKEIDTCSKEILKLLVDEKSIGFIQVFDVYTSIQAVLGGLREKMQFSDWSDYDYTMYNILAGEASLLRNFIKGVNFGKQLQREEDDEDKKADEEGL